jgi:Gas vesicle synthesis protein GvpL/GvpF
MIGTATGWYVYGVAEQQDGLEAIAHVVGRGRLAALVAEVPLDEYGEETLRERLNDRAWLEDKARAHEEVLQAVAAIAPVVPLRFGTIYDDLADVERLLDTRGPSFESVLERVRGCVELGVKAWAEPSRLAAAIAGHEPAGEEPSGRAYLQRRQREQRLAAEVAARSAELAEDAHRRLLAAAVDGVASRPQSRELSGRDEPMILNGAYLVATGDDALRAEVERLAVEHEPLGVTYEVTGPWPPHNFVET